MFKSSYITTEKLPVQSVPITTNIVSLNPAHGEVYSIQHYVIKFFSDLWFSLGPPVSSTNACTKSGSLRFSQFSGC